MDKQMTAKDKVLYILKRNGEISMKELAEHFTISDIAVRKHVQSLIWDGFIKKRTERQDIGRPHLLYSLTQKGHQTFPNQYEELPVNLLQDLQELEGEEVVDKLLRYRKKREEIELEKQLSDENFDERIEKMFHLQEEKGYLMDFKKQENGDYKMKIFNCPVYNVASEFHQVCRNEVKLYRNIFPNSEVRVDSYLTKGASHCSWYISKEDNKKSKVN